MSRGQWQTALATAHEMLGLDATHQVKACLLTELIAARLGVAVPETRADRRAVIFRFVNMDDERLTRRYSSFSKAFRAREARAVRPRLVKPRPSSRETPHPASVEFLSSYEWRVLRMQVLKERGARCECCGATPQDGTTVINVDHIKPRRTHPELALVKANLQVLCHACNHGKGNWDQTDWRKEA